MACGLWKVQLFANVDSFSSVHKKSFCLRKNKHRITIYLIWVKISARLSWINKRVNLFKARSGRGTLCVCAWEHWVNDWGFLRVCVGGWIKRVGLGKYFNLTDKKNFSLWYIEEERKFFEHWVMPLMLMSYYLFALYFNI